MPYETISISNPLGSVLYTDLGWRRRRRRTPAIFRRTFASMFSIFFCLACRTPASGVILSAGHLPVCYSDFLSGTPDAGAGVRQCPTTASMSKRNILAAGRLSGAGQTPVVFKFSSQRAGHRRRRCRTVASALKTISVRRRRNPWQCRTTASMLN